MSRRLVGLLLAAALVMLVFGLLLVAGPQVIAVVAFAVVVVVYGYILITAESEAVTTQKVRPLAAGQIIGATLWMALLLWGGFWS